MSRDVAGIPARGSLDTNLTSIPSDRNDRRVLVISVRVSEAEMWMLQQAITPEIPTVTEVIRSRVFGKRLRPVSR